MTQLVRDYKQLRHDRGLTDDPYQPPRPDDRPIVDVPLPEEGAA